MRKHPRNPRAGEHGSILIWVALFMLLMLGFVALGVDGAKLMATRTQLQNAADAAALAGASAVNYSTGLIDQARAEPLARAASANNKAFIGGPSPVLDAVVTFPQPDRCQVDVSRTGSTAIVTHLAHVVGVRTLDATATATAEVTRPDCVFGLRPLGVGNATEPFQYVVGQEYALMQGFASGNYQHLDFSQIDPPLDPPCTQGPCAGVGGQGGALLRCMIQNGLGCCVGQGRRIRVQTGVSSGPVGQAIDALFDDYGDIRTQYPSNQTNTYPVYRAAGGNDSRVVVVPLVQFVPTGCKGNNCWAEVHGFASFFLKRRYSSGQKTFYGEYIKLEVPGQGTGGDGTTYSIRLVK
jgi:Flp pilus assembly protein TadG